jgi:hypothetical protein
VSTKRHHVSGVNGGDVTPIRSDERHVEVSQVQGFLPLVLDHDKDRQHAMFQQIGFLPKDIGQLVRLVECFSANGHLIGALMGILRGRAGPEGVGI